MLPLAGELGELREFLLKTGLYPCLAVVSVGVFVLSYIARAIENYIRHLHKKEYLHYSSPRFILATIGYILVADGFLIGAAFETRLPLGTASVTVSAGLLCLIVAAAMSLVPHIRQVRRIREDAHLDEGNGPDRDGGGTSE